MTGDASVRLQVRDEFIAHWVNSAEDLALLLAGEPDAKVTLTLAILRANIEEELTKAALSVDMHSLIDRFIKLILDRKTEMEQGAVALVRPAVT